MSAAWYPVPTCCAINRNLHAAISDTDTSLQAELAAKQSIDCQEQRCQDTESMCPCHTLQSLCAGARLQLQRVYLCLNPICVGSQHSPDKTLIMLKVCCACFHR
jgi:hypothetical protein